MKNEIIFTITNAQSVQGKPSIQIVHVTVLNGKNEACKYYFVFNSLVEKRIVVSW